MPKIIKIYSKNTPFPTEDSWIVKENEENCSIIVADGVTRYLLRHATDKEDDSLTKEEQLKEYPNPSPAKAVADKFCESSIKNIQEEKSLKKVFKKANDEILDFGFKENPEPNLMENDYWGCVASMVRIKNLKIEWGFICDCGVCIWDKEGKIKFKTLDEGTQTVNKMTEMFKPYFGEEVKNARTFIGRVLLRGLFQNRLTSPRGDITKGFGVMNGDRNAIDYVRTGELELERGDIVGVYSDGLTKSINRKDVSIAIKNKNFEEIKRICDENVENEGTLILFDTNN